MTMERGSEPARSADGGSGGATGGHDEEAVRRRAYELYQARGGQAGRDADDWYLAERELRERGAAPRADAASSRAGEREMERRAEPAADGGASGDAASGRAESGTAAAPDGGADSGQQTPVAAPRAKGRATGTPRTSRSRRGNKPDGGNG